MMWELEDPRKVFGKAITDLAYENKNIVALSADSGKSSGLMEFIKKMPDRYFECGIMEQAVIGMASGLASAGKIPVFCAIAPFVTARPFEMFRNDLGYMHQNAKIVGRNGGITYSDLGSTHHSLDDFGIIRMIPDIVILSPQDPGEIRTACKAMIEYQGPVYMRIGNGKIPCLFKEEEFVIGNGKLIQEGRDVTIVSTGTVTASVMEAAHRLEEEGISSEIIGLPTVFPLDEKLILESVRKTGKIVTVEEHYSYGGIGTMIADLLGREYPAKIYKIAIPHGYATSGPYEEIMHKYGLDAEGVIQNVKSFLMG